MQSDRNFLLARFFDWAVQLNAMPIDLDICLRAELVFYIFRGDRAKCLSGFTRFQHKFQLYLVNLSSQLLRFIQFVGLSLRTLRFQQIPK